MLIKKQYKELILLEIWNETEIHKFFIAEETKETILGFSNRTVKVL